jgi:hypothetical protein
MRVDDYDARTTNSQVPRLAVAVCSAGYSRGGRGSLGCGSTLIADASSRRLARART